MKSDKIGTNKSINVFNNLKRKRLLDFIKYNENIRKRIHINNNDYKQYSEKYSSIEIEIKTIKNKYVKFINIKNEEEKYYHIFFNNNKEEVKRNYINKGEEIKIIRIKIDYKKFGKFININKEDKKYYHIYFNNNKKEIKINYIKEGGKINIQYLSL